MYTSAVIVPTCGLKNTTPLLAHSLFYNTPTETLIVFSINPFDKKEATATMQDVRKTAKIAEIDKGAKVNFIEVWSDEAIGFCNAVNKGYRACVEECGGEDKLPETIIVLNDDVEVAADWVEKLEYGFKTKNLVLPSTMVNAGFPIKTNEYYKVGICVPISNIGKPDQILNPPEQERGVLGQSAQVINNYLSQKREAAGLYQNTEVFSGFCYAIKKELLLQLCDESYSHGGFLDDKNFPIGGFDDDDLALRVLNLGWKIVISKDNYIHHNAHSTLEKFHPEQNRGLSNRINFYKKYQEETQRKMKVVAAYRVAIKTLNDLVQFTSSIRKAATVLDGFAMLLTNNPSEALNSYDSPMISTLPERERLFLQECQNLDNAALARLFEEWCYQVACDVKEKGYDRVNREDVTGEVWVGEFNERDERNLTHEMAESIGADWVFSIDHDEVFEDRITRVHIENCVNTPNPQVLGYKVGWINHWESMSIYRTDYPFCKGYERGMVGVRLWRVIKNKPLRIHAGTDIGLHCGNSPEFSPATIRDSSIRFRHLSLLRNIDRDNKSIFYNSIDKEKNETLLAGFTNYSHLTRKENVQVSMYNPQNGVGFSMLCYENENVASIHNWLEIMSGFADKTCLVWTGEWEEKDKEWMEKQITDWPSKDNWYKTGPSYDLAYGSFLYNCHFIHKQLSSDGLAECRNAGLDYLIENNADRRMGWFLFMDPDEQPYGDFGSSLRRCTESVGATGFLFTFGNVIEGHSKPVISKSIRLVKLHPEIRLKGRVHETFEKSLSRLREQGVAINVDNFPVRIVNTGLRNNAEAMKDKLLKYQNLLLEELKDDPLTSSSWLSLGLQFINDDDKENYVTCLERACLTAKTAYLPFQEMGLHHLRESRGFFLNVLQRCNRDASLIESTKAVLKFLDEYAPVAPKIDTGENLSSRIKLPPFPYDRITVSETGELVIDESKS